MKTKHKGLFSAVWLPIYLLVGVSWLLAPALAHEHYGVLRLISGEEAAKGVGIWFRVCDVAAAGLLLIAVLRFRVGRYAQWFGKAIVLVTVLAAIDGLFPDTCYIGHASCGLVAESVSAVHDIETILLTALIAGLSIIDALRHRRAASIGFVIVQTVAAFWVVSSLATPQMRVLLQYAYEVAMIIWLGWLVDRYNPVPLALGHERPVRRVLGIWVAAGGVFALVMAIPHVHFLGAWAAHNQRAPYGLLLAQHGIVTGMLMLYLARHLLRGERPALWLATILFYTQIIKYAVLTPDPAGLIVYSLLFVMLIYARRSFDRNTELPSWLSRVEDLAMVVGGLVIAMVVALSVVSITGQRERLLRDVQVVFGRPLYALDAREEHLGKQREARLRTLGETALVSFGIVGAWSLFRPKTLHGRSEYHITHMQFERLLQRYADSSEDYFKLWPQDKAYFCPPGLTGAIAYRVEGGVAFMLADPVAPSDREREQLLRAFREFCRSHGWVLCALLISSKSPELYQSLGLQTLKIGSSAVIDIAHFNAETSRDKWWRWQRNRATRNGWEYEKLVPPHDSLTLQALRRVSDAWLRAGGKTEQGFALGYYSEAYLQRCVLHVLRDREGEVVAFANEVPHFGHVSQTTVDLIRYVPDSDGAMPALLLHTIASLDETHYRTFDLGFVPLAKLDSELARLMRRIGQNRFSATGLERFKNKFDPQWWPDYIAYDGDLIDLARIAGNLEHLLRVEAENEVQ